MAKSQMSEEDEMAENTKKTKANKEKAGAPTTYLPQDNVRRGLTKWTIVQQQPAP
jgi:hypothetical protein